MESIGRIEIAGAVSKSKRQRPMGFFLTVEPLPNGGWRMEMEAGTGPQESAELYWADATWSEVTRIELTGGPDEPSPLSLLGLAPLLPTAPLAD